jgi:hypothetical protein
VDKDGVLTGIWKEVRFEGKWATKDTKEELSSTVEGRQRLDLEEQREDYRKAVKSFSSVFSLSKVTTPP